ncbi:hypothetical protein GS891_03755 [Rhodococcus hoagii]|nr:hypothetical protein [Prescottella equi]
MGGRTRRRQHDPRADGVRGGRSVDRHAHRCVRPAAHLALSTSDDAGAWRLAVDLREADGTTELTLTHVGVPDEAVSEIGPGWEYYLDMLVAARNRTPLPDFANYFPSQSGYYRDLAANLG